MNSLRYLPLIGSMVCALAVTTMVVELSKAFDKSMDTQLIFPRPLDAETWDKFNREFELLLRTQQTETLTEVKTQRDILTRIETAVTDLTKQTAEQSTTPSVQPQVVLAAEKEGTAVEVLQVVTSNQCKQLRQQPTRVYCTPPQRRVLSWKNFQNNCEPAACSKP